jgi:hypothetical protein
MTPIKTKLVVSKNFFSTNVYMYRYVYIYTYMYLIFHSAYRKNYHSFAGSALKDSALKRLSVWETWQSLPDSLSLRCSIYKLVTIIPTFIQSREYRYKDSNSAWHTIGHKYESTHLTQHGNHSSVSPISQPSLSNGFRKQSLQNCGNFSDKHWEVKSF